MRVETCSYRLAVTSRRESMARILTLLLISPMDRQRCQSELSSTNALSSVASSFALDRHMAWMKGEPFGFRVWTRVIPSSPLAKTVSW